MKKLISVIMLIIFLPAQFAFAGESCIRAQTPAEDGQADVVAAAMGGRINFINTDAEKERNYNYLVNYSNLSVQEYHKLIENILCNDIQFVRGTLLEMGEGDVEQLVSFDNATIEFLEEYKDTRIYKVALFSKKRKILFVIAIGQKSCDEENKRDVQDLEEISYKMKNEFEGLVEIHSILPENSVHPYAYTETKHENHVKYPVFSMSYITNNDGIYLSYLDGEYRVTSSLEASPEWQMTGVNFQRFIKGVFKLQIILYEKLGKIFNLSIPAAALMYASQKDTSAIGPNLEINWHILKTVSCDEGRPIIITSGMFCNNRNLAYLVRSFFRTKQIINQGESDEDRQLSCIPPEFAVSALRDSLNEVFQEKGDEKTIEWLRAYLKEYGDDESSETVSFVRDFVDRLVLSKAKANGEAEKTVQELSEVEVKEQAVEVDTVGARAREQAL